MRRFVDLHIHSTASDGQLSPGEVIRLADADGLAAAALTDHDTTAGLAEAEAAAKEFPELRFIAGVEISARVPAGTLHILGLGVDPNCLGLQETLREMRRARDERNPKIVAALCRLGAEISMEEVFAAAGRRTGGGEGLVVGRLHIAEALRRRGHVRTVQEAFDRYIGNDGPAYVDKERLEPHQAIGTIHDAGGVAVLAHPAKLKYENTGQLGRILRSLVSVGLDGIEVYHTDHTPQQTRCYLDLARRRRLLVTGGSDFHGPAKPGARLGWPRVPLGVMDGIAGRGLLGEPPG